MSKETEENHDTITIGKYIIICKKDYSKIHLLANNSTVMLGKDKVELNGIAGHLFWSTFKMIQKKSKREYTVALCSREEILKAVEIRKPTVTSGEDNRNIWDDGSSQQLTTEQIVELKDKGLSSQDIVETLIENSKTFHSKTEYSQEKYLKKKGTKYFEYLTIKKPTIRILCEILCHRNQTKMLGLRMDSISQIVTAVSLQSDGKYILYETGCQGLVAATILNYLSDNGKLIQITPGRDAQRHALLAMNFSEHRKAQVKCIQLPTLFPVNTEELGNSLETLSENNNLEGLTAPTPTLDPTPNDSNTSSQKRKNEETSDYNNIKKPRREVEAEEAAQLLNLKNSDGLVIVCKEHPLNITISLLQYLAPSRPFVVFCLHREPLVQLYQVLRPRKDVINIKLTETWLRSYQVLEGRTHPEVLMSGNSGYLLVGTIVGGSST